MVEVNILNILDVDSADLGIWIAGLINNRSPRPGPNHTLNIPGEILPFLADITDKQTLLTELYVVVVGATPTLTAVRTAGKSEDNDPKARSEVLNRKKDIIYRALQTLEAQRETASRMITGVQLPTNSRF